MNNSGQILLSGFFTLSFRYRFLFPSYSFLILILFSSFNILNGFEDINLTGYGQTADQAVSKLEARALDNFNRQITDQKVSIFSRYGLIYKESMQSIPYTPFKEIFKSPGRIQIRKDNNHFTAVCQINAGFLREECNRLSRDYYQKAMKSYLEFQNTPLNRLNFQYQLNLIVKATDEMISCTELNREEQINALMVFQAFEHFLNQFVFIVPDSQLMTEESARQKYLSILHLYFSQDQFNIPLPDIQVSVFYPDRVEKMVTDQSGTSTFRSPDNISLKYQIHIEPLFESEDLINPLFIKAFVKKFLTKTNGSFMIETLRKRRLLIESTDFRSDELSEVSRYYAKKGYVLSDHKTNNSYTIKVRIVLTEDKKLHIGGYFVKGYVLLTMHTPSGEQIETRKSAVHECLSEKDRKRAIIKLHQIMRNEISGMFK